MKKCIIEDCNNKWIAQKLCPTHYGRAKRAGKIEPVLPQHPPINDLYWCTGCRNYKHESEFHKHTNTRVQRQLNIYCKSCKQINTRSYTYNISKEKVKKLFEEAGNQCEVCENRINLTIDHDHNCCPGSKSCGKCVRGVLCNDCNLTLGMIETKTEKIDKLIDYLSKFDLI